MEQTLGKPHTVSPFTGLYAKYGISSSNTSLPTKQPAPAQPAPAKGQPAASNEESKKPKQQSNNNQKEPKQQ